MSRRAGRLAGYLAGFRRDRSGQALMEFAIALPVLLALLIGIVELGQAWRSQQVLTHAAREGARLAIVPTSTPELVSARVRETLQQGGLDPARAELMLALRSGTGSLDTVRIRYPQPFPMMGPVVRLVSPSGGDVPPGSVRLTSMFVMRNE